MPTASSYTLLLSNVFSNIHIRILTNVKIIGKNENFGAQLICSPNGMTVVVTSKLGPFNGIIYTEGSYSDDQCRLQANGQTSFTVAIPYHLCNTRVSFISLLVWFDCNLYCHNGVEWDDWFENEDGAFTNVLIVQHRRQLLTNEDAAFQLRCDASNRISHVEQTGIVALHTMNNKLAMININNNMTVMWN